MKGDKLMAVCDDSTLSIIDIEKSSIEKHTQNNQDLTKLFKLPFTDAVTGIPTFAGVTKTG
jgi:hypothetical protein